MGNYSFFSRNGVRWILSGVLLSGFLWAQFNFYFALPAMVATLLIMRFYYDQDRELPSHPLGVMSPVDGTVVGVDLVDDPFLHRAAQRIRIKSDWFGLYYGRSPTEGKLMEFWPVLSEDKQQYKRGDTKGVFWIQTDEADDLVVVATKPGWMRMRCDIQAGERVGQSRRCGRFPPCSLIDILVDDASYIKTAPGKKVKAGVDCVASFNHDHAVAL